MTTSPCLMIDIEGTELQPEEAERLQHPAVAGVLLFARNASDPENSRGLIDAIRQAVKRPFLIACDQEGGRVQRFKEGFTRLPAVAEIGKRYARDRTEGLKFAQHHAVVLACEMQSIGIDLSYAPVLDIDQGHSSVIGDRSFSSDTEALCDIATHYMRVLNALGMPTTVKHFPGHGCVSGDSHYTLPYDSRELEDILETDGTPFLRLMGSYQAIMPAHIVFEKVDSIPCSFSKHWLQTILRDQIGFKGCIVSDDLCMAGAAIMGGFVERTEAALDAGNNLVLLSNNPNEAEKVLDQAKLITTDPHQAERIAALARRPSAISDTERDSRYHQAKQSLLEWQ